jgi:hypothetical protein
LQRNVEQHQKKIAEITGINSDLQNSQRDLEAKMQAQHHQIAHVQEGFQKMQQLMLESLKYQAGRQAAVESELVTLRSQKRMQPQTSEQENKAREVVPGTVGQGQAQTPVHHQGLWVWRV